MKKTAELVLDCHAELGEGPIWDDKRQHLLWADSRRNSLNVYDPASGDNQVYDIGQRVGTVCPAKIQPRSCWPCTMALPLMIWMHAN